MRPPPLCTLFPSTTLFRSKRCRQSGPHCRQAARITSVSLSVRKAWPRLSRSARTSKAGATPSRSEEHTSELQSQSNLVCRLLLEKKKDTRRGRPVAPELHL